MYVVFAIGVVALLPAGGFYGCIALNEHLRIRDAEPAFQSLTSLGCHIYSQPTGSRYCRYLVIFPEGTGLSDDNIDDLAPLNRLPANNFLDVVIETDNVTDRSVDSLASIKTIDLLVVVDSGISDTGIEDLKQRMPDTWVNSRETRLREAP